MKKKYGIIVIKLERHWVIIASVLVVLGLLYFGETYADQSNCSKKNPTIDCSVTGTIDLSAIQSQGNWTKTTGLGSHWALNPQTGGYVPIPEYRAGYYHAVCYGFPINSTCYWHIDKYPATSDIPFGTILHLADYMTINSPIGSEDFWQLFFWVLIVAGIAGAGEGIARLIDYLR